MSEAVTPIVIPVITDFSKSIDSMKEFNEGVDQLKTSLDTIKNNNQGSIIPGFEDDIDRQIQITEKNIDHLSELRKQISNAETPEAQNIAKRNFELAYKRAQSTVMDLAESIKASQDVSFNSSDILSQYMSKALKQETPGIRRALKQLASNLAKTGNVSDEQILDIFEKSSYFTNLLSRMQQQNKDVSSQDLRNVARAVMPSAVSQIHRNRFLNWERGDYKEPQTVRDRLPSSFGSISLQQHPEYRNYDPNAERLTSKERKKLENIIKAHPYMSQEFEKADIIRKYNGEMYLNPNVNRSHVSALGGLTARLFEAGIRGGPHTGIVDVENPSSEKQLVSMLKKNNLSTSNSEKLASSLSSAFEWFVPEHIQIEKAKRGDISGWSSIGTVNATPRETAAHFLELRMDQISPEGDIIFDKDDQGRVKKNYLRTPFNLAHKELSKLKGADPFELNGYNTNAIYVQLPTEELGDFNTSPERKEEIKKQLASTLGTKIKGPDGRAYRFANLTPSHAFYVPEDLYEEEMKIDPNFFWNGEDRRKFTNFEDFGRAIENAKKIHTQGEDIESLYGTDLSHANVVVTDLKKLKDEVLTNLDGQNFISRRLVPKSFQGRDFSGKSTFSVFDLDKLWEMYPQFVDESTGDLVFPKGGISGGELRIPKGTDILEDYSNIKSKHQYDGLTQEELNRARTEEVRSRGILAKSTTEDFATSARYISSQAAATMKLNPAVKDFFRKEYITRLDSLNNVDAVKELLFSGDDDLSRAVQDDEGLLALPEAQERINDYRKSLISNVGAGKLLVPRGKANYGMISAWLPDVISNLIPEDQLTEEQKSWRLGDANFEHSVAYFANLADNLMLFRNPSTLSGNIEAHNDAGKTVSYGGQETTFKDFARVLGVDPEALYVNPKDALLELMQSADEDGDTAFITAIKRFNKEGVLKENYNEDFANVISYLVEESVSRYKQMREISGRTAEQQEIVNKAHTLEARAGKDLYELGGTYSDVSDFIEGFAEQGGAMGFANAVSVNGSQWRATQKIVNGILDAEAHYDVDSNGRIKYNRKWNPTQDEWDLLLGGAPLYQMYNWATKDLQDKNNEYGETESGPDYKHFNNRRIDALNFPTRYDSHGQEVFQELFYTRNARPEIEMPFDWDEIFAQMPNEYQNMPHINKWLQRTRDLRKSQLKGEFYGFDDSVVTELEVLAANAFGELIRSDIDPKDIRSKALRLGLGDKFLGGRVAGVAENLKTSGLLKSFIESNPEMKAEAEALMNFTGEDGFYVSAQGIPEMAYLGGEDAREALKRQHNANAKKQREAQQKKAEAEQTVQETEKEIENLSKEKKITPKQAMTNLLDEVLPIENGNSWSSVLKGKGTTSKKSIAQKVAQEITAPILGDSAPTEEVINSFLKANGLTAGSTEEEIANVVTSILDKKTKEAKDQTKQNAERQKRLKEAEAKQAEAKQQIEESDQELKSLDEEQKNIQKKQKDFEADYETQIEYERIMESAKSFSSKLYKDFTKEEDKINGVSKAESYYKMLNGFARAHLRELDLPEEKLKNLSDEQVKRLNEEKRRIEEGVDREFADRGVADAHEYASKVDEILGKKNGTLSSQGTAIKAIQEQIDEYVAYYDMYEKLSESGTVSDNAKSRYKKAASEIKQDIDKIQAGKEDLIKQFTKDNEESGQLAIENLKIQSGLLNKNSYKVRSASRLRAIEKQRKTVKNQYNEGVFSKEEYDKQLNELDKLQGKSSEGQLLKQDLLKSAGAGIIEPFKMITSRLKSQLLFSALNEVKSFVKQYDKAMTEIQMITLKSDTQIQSLGDNLIDVAKKLKASVSDITTSAATLYRQGLSDAEVDERLGVITKFSKVSGTKVADATKLITVAMNTGLVTDPGYAADVVTALGDSAATNAAQIEKGIEKAGAAAAADGTSFGELAAMLTAITSTTQIGGNVAGRTINTIMGRMNKIGTNELIYDENGKAMSGSAVAELLRAQGIETYENGNKRSTFDVLYDLSKKWDTISDAEQQQIANAIAGTRQYSNFAAIMQGMAEGDIDEYMKLLNDSEGITDKKYDAYLQSLEASLAELKSTFDGLIETWTDSKFLTGAIGGITNLIQGVDNLSGSIGGLGASLITVLPLLAGLGMIQFGMHSGMAGLPVLAAGIATVAVGAGVAGIAGSQQTASEKYKESQEYYKNNVESLYSNVDRLKGLRKKTDRTDSEQEEYESLINSVGRKIGLITTPLNDASSSVDGLSASIKSLANSADEAADKVIKEADEEKDKSFAANIASNLADRTTTLKESVSEAIISDVSENKTLTNSLYSGTLWDYNKETKEWTLKDNALSQLNSLVETGKESDKLFGLVGWLSKMMDGKHALSFEDDLADSLSQMFANASVAGKMGPSEVKTGSKLWKNRLLSGVIEQSDLEAMFEYAKSFSDGKSPNDVKRNFIKNGYKSILQDLLSPEGYNEGEIEYLADLAAGEIVKTGNYNSAETLIFGTDLTSGSAIKKTIDQNLEPYRKKNQTVLEKYGLEDVGVYGYYIDQKTGQRITEEEAKRQVDNYNATIAQIETNREQQINQVQEEATKKAEEDAKAEALKEYNKSIIKSKVKFTDGIKTYYSETGDLEAARNGVQKRIDKANAEIDARVQQSRDQWHSSTPFDENFARQLAKKELGYEDLKDEVEVINGDLIAETWEDIPEEQRKIIEISAKTGEIATETLDEINQEAEAALKEVEKNKPDIVGKKDHFNSAIVTGNNAWKSDNAQKVLADQALEYINNPTYGIKSLKDFVKYINDNDIGVLDPLLETGTIGRLLSQADIRGNEVVSAPEGIWENFISTLYSMSSNGEYLSISDKANRVNNIIDRIGANKIRTTQASIETDYNKYLERGYKEYLAQYIGSDFKQKGILHKVGLIGEKPLSQEVWEKTQALSQKEWQKKNNVELLSELDDAYLKEILGEDLANQIKSPNATNEEIDLALQKVNNARFGYAGLTSADKLTEAKNIRDLISQGKLSSYSELAASQYMSDFSNWSSLASLQRKKETERLTPEEEKLLEGYNTELDQLIKNSEIEIQVSGLSSLEEAGTLLEGTANLIKELQRGGSFKIKAELEIQSNATERLQQAALLNNGTFAEQIQAIEDITGLSSTEIGKDFSGSKDFAQKYLASQKSAIGSYYDELINSVGFDSDEGDLIDAIARKEGFIRWNNTGIPGDFKYMERSSVMEDLQNRLNNASDTSVLDNLLQKAEEYNFGYTQDKKTGAYTLVDNQGNPVSYANPWLGQEASYTDYQLARARADIIKNGYNENNVLHRTAATSGGTYFNEYERMLTEEAAANGTYSAGQLEAARKKAEQEANLALKDAENTQKLEDARLNSGTLGGMYQYAQEQYRQNNKAGLAANDIYRSLSTANVSSVEDLMHVLGDRRNADNWQKLLESSPELAKKLKDLGLSIGEDGKWDVTGLTDSTNAVQSAFQALISAIGGASEAFNEIPKLFSNDENIANAQMFLAGEKMDQDTGYNALRDVTGNDYLAQYALGNYIQYRDKADTYNQWQQEYDELKASGANQTLLKEKRAERPSRPGEYDPWEGLSEENKAYAEQIVARGFNGRTQETLAEENASLNRYLTAARSTSNESGLASFIGQDKLHQSDLVNGIDNIDAWEQVVRTMQDAGQGLDDYTSSSEAWTKACKEAGITTEQFEAATEALKTKIKDNNAAMKTSTGQAQKNASAIKNLNSQLAKAADNQFYKQSWQKGNRDKKTLEGIKSMTGLDNVKDEDIKKGLFDDIINSTLESVESSDVEGLQDVANEMMAGIETDLSKYFDKETMTLNLPNGVSVEIGSGGANISMDELNAAVGADMDAAQQALIASLQAYGIQAHYAVDENGDTVTGKVVIDSISGAGGHSKGGGGGGGGGGKSAIDTLLEKQKHEIAAAQHEIKMTQIQETHYDNLNQHTNYLNALDDEISKQEQLQSIYRNYIEEVKQAMAGLEQYSDDWWKAKEAIDSYEESLAEINNTLNDILAKRVDRILKTQEIQDKPSTQKQSLWGERARGYQIRGQFESYAASETNRINEINSQKALNDKQIKELENELRNQYENSDAWLKARDQIWALQLENAKLANDQEEARRALMTATIQQYQTDLQNRLAPGEHETNMLSGWGQLYQTNRQYDYYRSTLSQSNDMNTRQAALYRTYLEEMQKQLEVLPEGSEAWYAARDAVYQYEEALLQVTSSIDETNRAIEQSKVDELKDKFDQINKSTDHSAEILEIQMDRYDKNNNFTMYQQVLSERASVESRRLVELQEQLQAYIDLSEELKEDSDAWRDNEEQARATEKAIEQAKNQLEEYDRLATQSEFEHYKEIFQRQNDLDQHNLKMIQYQTTRYQNAGELTNVNTMLRNENEQRLKMIDTIREQIKVYKEQLAAAEEGSDEYYDIAKALYQLEEQEQDYSNAVEKNTEQIHKNEEAILKTHKTLVDTINNEIQTRIKEQRERLSAEVSIQNQILNIIRARYKAEWA